MLSALATHYTHLSSRSPFLTAAAVGASTGLLGDALCQLYVERLPYDARRGLELGVVRGLVIAPLLQLYFPWLARRTPGAAQSWAAVGRRLLLDQCVGAPANALITFTCVELLRGRPDAVLPRIQAELLPTWGASASFWPFVHLVNFRLVAPQHNALVANLAAVPWGVLLSYRANSAVASPGEQRTEKERVVGAESLES